MYSNTPSPIVPGGKLSASQFNRAMEQTAHDQKALRAGGEGNIPGPGQVDNQAVRLGYNPVRVYTTSLATFTQSENTLTASANGALASIDGVSLDIGDRLLYNPDPVNGNVAAGVYEVFELGSASTKWVLQRTFDGARDADFVTSYILLVGEGTNHRGSAWRLNTQIDTANPVTLNVTPLAWAAWTMPFTYKYECDPTSPYRRKEYKEYPDGTTVFVRDTGDCCTPCGSGSGSGGCCAVSTSVCLTLSSSGSFYGTALNGVKVTLTETYLNVWEGSITVSIPGAGADGGPANATLRFYLWRSTGTSSGNECIWNLIYSAAGSDGIRLGCAAGCVDPSCGGAGWSVLFDRLYYGGPPSDVHATLTDGACAGSGSGATDNCCSGSSTLTGTITNKVGCWTAAPGTVTFNLNIGFYQAILSPPVCDGANLILGCHGAGTLPYLQAPGGVFDAQAGYVCTTPKAMVFLVNDGAGNSCTVTVTG